MKRTNARFGLIRRRTSAVVVAAWLAALPTFGAAADGSYRTNVNPALLYWQFLTNLPKDSDAQKVLDAYQTAPLDDRYSKLVQEFNYSFMLLRRAARIQTPCDWGIDLADGPDTRLPHLAQARSMARSAALRARYFLNHGQEDEAIQDLSATVTLARRLGADAILISVLVQYSIEGMVMDAIAENFYAFSPDGLKRLVAEIDAVPRTGSISQCIGKGERSFVHWYSRKIEESLAAHPGQEAKAMAEIREVFAGSISSTGKDYATADEFIAAGGGTPQSMLQWVRGVNAWYDEFEAIAALPRAEFFPANQAFVAKIAASKNPLVAGVLPSLEKARSREFRIEGRLAMLRGALAYRLKGISGINEVQDPLGSAPFEFKRFEFEQQDRGFELRSPGNVAGDGPETCIFVEKPGTPFRVSGPQAGKAFTKPQ